MKVVATKVYEELKLKAIELERIPKEGEIFEIKNEKFAFLNGNNPHKKVFVKKVNETLQNKEELDKFLIEDFTEQKENDNSKKELDEVLKDKNPKGKNK